jgi:hypothetical protein
VVEDSGLGDSPRQSSKSDSLDALPELGWRLSVSGRRLRVGRLRPETPVPRGRRLRSVWLVEGCKLARTIQMPGQSWAGDFCLWPETPALESLRAETPALVIQQRLHFVEDYIKPSITSRSGCGFHSLSSNVAKLQSTRSLSLANRTQSPFGIRGRRPRSTPPPRQFDFPPRFVEGLVTRVSIGFLAGRSRPPSLTLCVRAWWAYWETPIELWSSPQYFV